MAIKRSKLILTIDDEEGIRKLFRDVLQGSEYDIIEAENGRIGIELIETRKPDLVLVDLVMPEVDGFQVLKYLQKKSPNTPAIVISSTDVLDIVIDAIRMGAWDYILKPIISFDVLKHTIQKAFEKASLIKENLDYQRYLEESNEKLRREMLMAQSIQMRLLPQDNLRLGDYFFKHHIYPSLFLSGDFLDYFLVDTSNIAFYFADVSGHGVSSALVTIYLRSFMQKYRDEYENEVDSLIIEPDRLLFELNKELLNEKFEKYLTIVYGIINLDDNSLTFANSGHYPYPIFCQNHSSKLLLSENPPVGLFQGQKFLCQKIRLPDNFSLSLFSDGILEVLPHKSIKEKTAFLTSLVQTNKQRYASFFNLIEQNKNGLADDIAILSVSRGDVNGE